MIRRTLCPLPSIMYIEIEMWSGRRSVEISDQTKHLVVVISRSLARRGKLCRCVQPYEAAITKFQQEAPYIVPFLSICLAGVVTTAQIQRPLSDRIAQSVIGLTCYMCIDVHCFIVWACSARHDCHLAQKMALEVAPGRQELPLFMRLSRLREWVGEQLVCPKFLGWRDKMGDVASNLFS